MNKLRINLIAMILVVGLIPRPSSLFSEEAQGCRAYDSALIHVRLEHHSCAIIAPDVVTIAVPGYFSPDTREILPHIIMLIWSYDQSNQTADVWGTLYQPYLWRDRSLVKNLSFRLSPEISIAWENDYGDR